MQNKYIYKDKYCQISVNSKEHKKLKMDNLKGKKEEE